MKFTKISYDQYHADRFSAIEPNDYVPTEEELKAEWEAIRLPSRATTGSAGYDFFAPMPMHFGPKPRTYPTGIRCELDDDKFLMACPKSSLGFRYGMMLENTLGIVDSDYAQSDNEGHILLRASAKKSFDLDVGKKYMQGIIVPYFKVDDDNATGIRNGGLGSTERN